MILKCLARMCPNRTVESVTNCTKNFYVGAHNNVLYIAFINIRFFFIILMFFSENNISFLVHSTNNQRSIEAHLLK